MAPTPKTLAASAVVAGAEISLTLDGADLRWGAAGSDEQRRLDLEAEVLGAERRGRAVVVKAFVAGEGPARCCGGAGEDEGRRVRRDFEFEMASEEESSDWAAAIGTSVDSQGSRPKRLFVMVNPFSGKKCARKIYSSEVKPLFDAAGIHISMQETTHQLHAQEIASSLDLSEYDGIVCVSGDGILVEVLNGLLHRSDWENAIKMPLGIVPAGTGNGIAKSLSHFAGDAYSIPNAVFAIIKGHKRALDVATIFQGQKKYFSILLLTWGLVADIDIESEIYRWMGSARIDFYSVIRILNLRRYNGNVKFVPAPGHENYGEPVSESDSLFTQGSVTETESLLTQQCENGKDNFSDGYGGSSVKFETSEWRSMDGPFVVIWVNNVPWSAENIMPAPQAKFADGYLDTIIVRDCPKLALLNLLLKMSDGSHVKSPYVTYLKVKAIQLTPGKRVDDPKKGGIIDCDGEVIARDGLDDAGQHHLMAYGPPIQMTVDSGLATIFTPK